MDLAVALGEVQRKVPREALAATGLAVFDPDDAVARLDEKLAWFSALPDGHPARLAVEDRERALVRMEAVVAQWRELAVEAPAVGLDHNDLHAGNAYPGPRISDWGDAVVGHPFCSLRPLLFAANSVFGPAAADEVRQAYLAGWGDPAQLAPVLDVALKLAVPQRLHCWVQLDDAAAVATYAEYVVPLMREVGRAIEDVTQP